MNAAKSSAIELETCLVIGHSNGPVCNFVKVGFRSLCSACCRLLILTEEVSNGVKDSFSGHPDLLSMN